MMSSMHIDAFSNALTFHLSVLAGLTAFSLLALGLSYLGLLELPASLPWLMGLVGTDILALTLHLLLRKQLEQHAQLAGPAPLRAEKRSLLLNIFNIGLIACHHALLNAPMALLVFWSFPALQCQLNGRRRLAWYTLLICGLLWSTSLLFIGLPDWNSWPQPFGTLGLLIPLAVLMRYGQQVGFLVRQQQSEVEELQSLASIDALTGLMNRRQFNNRLSGEIARAHRHRSTLSLVLFDIDNFKRLNDFYGHPTGDRILKELGQLIAANVRESDIAARYGGEEFALILPETRQIEAYDLLERLRRVVEKTVFCLPDNPLTLTVSIGVTQLDLERHTMYDFVQEADQALYDAKRNGKNRVVLHGYGDWQPQDLSEEHPVSS